MENHNKVDNHATMEKSSYKKFGFMMLFSFVLMYTIMFLNVFTFEHVYSSVMRLYMTLLMVSSMAVSMLLFM